MSKEEETLTDAQIEYVSEYVDKNYRHLKNKDLIVKKLGNCIGVLDHPDGSPLILSMKFLDGMD